MSLSNTSKGVSVSDSFGQKQAELMEADVKQAAANSLKARQDTWKLMSKIKSDLESLKTRSPEEQEKLDEANKYLLLNTKPAMGGKKSRKHKKGSKKTRKHKKGSRRR
jgi:beta-glucosidase-like glycosyl hydrolase